MPVSADSGCCCNTPGLLNNDPQLLAYVARPLDRRGVLAKCFGLKHRPPRASYVSITL
jgi:hypothetical protein